MRAIRFELVPHHAVWTLAGALAGEKRQQLDVLVGGDLNTNYSWYMCARKHTHTCTHTEGPCINQCRCESQKGGLACKHKHQGKCCTQKNKKNKDPREHTRRCSTTHVHTHVHLAYRQLTKYIRVSFEHRNRIANASLSEPNCCF